MRVHSILLPLLAVTSPAFVSAKTFSLPDGDVSAAELQGPWWNHNFCYCDCDDDSVESRQNSNELPEHPPELVPKGVIFLDFIYDFVTCSPVERTGTVPVDTKLVFIPIGVSSWYDLDDDVNSTVQDPGCAGRGGPELEASIDEDLSIFRNLTNYSQEPFANVNENALEPFFLLWEEEFYYSACPNDPGKELCDECDVNFQPPEGCQPVAGVDVYPMYGWWAADETEWTCGETRVYNFGGVLGEGDNAVCVNTTYTLSAYDETCPPPSSDANTVMYNGIFSFILLVLSLMMTC